MHIRSRFTVVNLHDFWINNPRSIWRLLEFFVITCRPLMSCPGFLYLPRQPYSSRAFIALISRSKIKHGGRAARRDLHRRGAMSVNNCRANNGRLKARCHASLIHPDSGRCLISWRRTRPIHGSHTSRPAKLSASPSLLLATIADADTISNLTEICLARGRRTLRSRHFAIVSL